MNILVDVGATNTRIAGSRDPANFSDPVIFDTPPTYDEGLRGIVDTARTIAAGEKIDAVCAGVPAVLSRNKRVLLKATNIPLWDNHAFADDLEKALEARVVLDNDTAFVGLGEAVFGAGIGAEIVVYITISTGVNGVRIVNGVIDPSAQGYEIGYQCVAMGTAVQEWGDLISGRAIRERFGKAPRELGKDNPVWEELAHIAAVGVSNAIVYWSPDRVVLGGSMTNEIGISVERIRVLVEENMKAYPKTPEIVHSKLGDLGGLWGGLVRLKQL